MVATVHRHLVARRPRASGHERRVRVSVLGTGHGSLRPGRGIARRLPGGSGCGNLAAGWVHEATMRGLGASGVVMGALGLLTVPSLILPKQQKANAFRLIAGGLLAGVLIFVLIGVNPETDVVAHFGGFVTGWLLGLVLACVSRFTRRPRVNLVPRIPYALLTIIPW